MFGHKPMCRGGEMRVGYLFSLLHKHENSGALPGRRYELLLNFSAKIRPN